MTPKELAEKLDGIEYGARIDKALLAEAKATGLVVAFGASDDLMEFRGAIDDEIGAPGKNGCRIDREGLVPDFELIDKNGRKAKDQLREYFRRENSGTIIRALWCPDETTSWAYETTIPHEIFRIMEDGEVYCRGIVFRLEDAA